MHAIQTFKVLDSILDQECQQHIRLQRTSVVFHCWVIQPYFSKRNLENVGNVSLPATI